MGAAAICAHTLPDTIRCLTRGTRLLVRSHRSPSVATHTLSRPQLAARRFLTSTMAAADKVSVGDLDAAAVAAQGERVRSLKADKAEQSVIEREVATLKQLKAQLQAQQGSALAKESSSKSKKGKLALKTPKGTKDWHPADMMVRNEIFRKITRVFELHGGVTIDTPVFELKEILAGKYGEDSKLIYDLQDQGGEICSLRYDLTVPFARFLAMNGKQYPNIKRYHIAKVYRRDQPAMTKGRMREFYQCDFDIAGTYDAMLPDSEILVMVCEVLQALEIGDFTIKLNHRKILDGIFEHCGVPKAKIRTISSAVDKLDKLPWEDVRKEMVEEKGLDRAVADKIGDYVRLKGHEELLERLAQDEGLNSNKSASAGLADMRLLFKYLNIYEVAQHVSFDLSLARGLDYYTGIIYEAVTEASAPPPHPVEGSSAPPKGADQDEDASVGVGSIAAGGRYDDLVGMFAGTGKDSSRIPCVGISFGVERLFSIMLAKAQANADGKRARGKPTEVFVMSVGDSLLEARMKVCSQLWKAGIKAEYLYKNKPKPAAQFDAVDRDSIPLVVIVAPDELAQGQVRVKEQLGKDAGQGKGTVVPRSELVSFISERLS